MRSSSTEHIFLSFVYECNVLVLFPPPPPSFYTILQLLARLKSIAYFFPPTTDTKFSFMVVVGFSSFFRSR